METYKSKRRVLWFVKEDIDFEKYGLKLDNDRHYILKTKEGSIVLYVHKDFSANMFSITSYQLAYIFPLIKDGVLYFKENNNIRYNCQLTREEMEVVEEWRKNHER